MGGSCNESLLDGFLWRIPKEPLHVSRFERQAVCETTGETTRRAGCARERPAMKPLLRVLGYLALCLLFTLLLVLSALAGNGK